MLSARCNNGLESPFLIVNKQQACLEQPVCCITVISMIDEHNPARDPCGKGECLLKEEWRGTITALFLTFFDEGEEMECGIFQWLDFEASCLVNI